MENKELVIYVAGISYGQYDDATDLTLYVGTDYEKALSVIRGFTYPDPYNNNAGIAHWCEGKQIKYDSIEPTYEEKEPTEFECPLCDGVVPNVYPDNIPLPINSVKCSDCGSIYNKEKLGNHKK